MSATPHTAAVESHRTRTVGVSTARAATSAALGADRMELANRIRNEYLEMPGLRLTLEQAQRLWQLRRTECEAVLFELIDAGFLTRTSKGAFVRLGLGRAGA